MNNLTGVLSKKSRLGSAGLMLLFLSPTILSCIFPNTALKGAALGCAIPTLVQLVHVAVPHLDPRIKMIAVSNHEYVEPERPAQYNSADLMSDSKKLKERLGTYLQLYKGKENWCMAALRILLCSFGVLCACYLPGMTFLDISRVLSATEGEETHVIEVIAVVVTIIATFFGV